MAPLPDLSSIGPKDFRAYKLRLDMYKLRAEEYRKRYESMRSLEWKVLFQVYAGYAAIAVAFFHVTAGNRLGAPGAIAVVAMAATVAFYIVTRYLNYRIEERLIVFHETYSAYLKAMQMSLDLDLQGPGTGALGAKYYWTYRAQLLLSTLTLTGLLLYEAAVGLAGQMGFAGAEIVLVTAVILVLGWVRVPPIP